MTHKKRLVLILAAAVVLFFVVLVTRTTPFSANFRILTLILFLVPYLMVGYGVLFEAFENILHGHVFDENFLMMIATFGAIAIGEYAEAVLVMLLYQVGELFQSYAVGKSRKSIKDMMDICPEYANLLKDGEVTRVDPGDVLVDSTIVVKPGERVPLDGVVVTGESFLDTTALTGESVPRRVRAGESVISGCVNGNGSLTVRVTKRYEDSTVTKILELVENASTRKAKAENFITKFARVYTPIVTIAAVLLFAIPTLFLSEPMGVWLNRACIFLVISCPCALVISVPLGFFGGIGAASRIGVLVKGSNYLEAVSKAGTMVFDKTGTLTQGVFRVRAVKPVKVSKDALLELAAYGEADSTHPIAEALREAYGRTIDRGRLSMVHELAGHGVEATVDGKRVLLGNEKLMEKYGITYEKETDVGTVVYCAQDMRFVGSIVIADEVKSNAAEALQELSLSGVNRLVMLTGDRKVAAAETSLLLGIHEYYAGLLPGDKVERMEELLRKQQKGEKLVFVGDGINDAPVLTRADIGIAMGSMGSDAAIEAADIVILDDDLRKLASIKRIATKTVRIVKQNIAFSLFIKAAVLLLSVFGFASMWAAIFADVGVSVLAILNSMRALKTGERQNRAVIDEKSVGRAQL